MYIYLLIYLYIFIYSCGLVGSSMLYHISMKYGKTFGLYIATAREVENIEKNLCAIFNKYGLKVTIEANKKTVNSSMSR